MPDRATSKRETFRDPALQASFDRDGYVVVDALDAHAARALRARAHLAIDSATPINDAQGALYGTLFDADRREIGAAVADEALSGLLASLLSDYRYEGGYVVAKPSSSGRLDMHQHQPVTRDIYETAVHCWLTLDDSGQDRGGLRIVPGSHAITRHVQSFDSPPYFASFADRLERDHARTLDLRAGQAVIFERSLLHGSEPNRADHPMLRILGTAIPQESRLCVLAEDQPGQFEALEVGDAVIDADLYCIVRENRAALRSAGPIANRNLALDEGEFVALVEAGSRIGPGSDPIDRVRSPRRWWRRA